MIWLHFNEVYTDKALPRPLPSMTMVNLDTIEAIEWSGHDFITLTLIMGADDSGRVIYVQAKNEDAAKGMYGWIKDRLRSGQDGLIDVTKYQP